MVAAPGDGVVRICQTQFDPSTRIAQFQLTDSSYPGPGSRYNLLIFNKTFKLHLLLFIMRCIWRRRLRLAVPHHVLEVHEEKALLRPHAEAVRHGSIHSTIPVRRGEFQVLPILIRASTGLVILDRHHRLIIKFIINRSSTSTTVTYSIATVKQVVQLLQRRVWGRGVKERNGRGLGVWI